MAGGSNKSNLLSKLRHTKILLGETWAFLIANLHIYFFYYLQQLKGMLPIICKTRKDCRVHFLLGGNRNYHFFFLRKRAIPNNKVIIGGLEEFSSVVT